MTKKKEKVAPCYNCEDRPAQKLTTMHGLTTKMFCTMRCAANWAMENTCDQVNAWCMEHGRFDGKEWDICPDCDEGDSESAFS